MRAGHGGRRGRRRLPRRHGQGGHDGRGHGRRRAGQPRPGRRAPARLPAGPGRRRAVHRDDRRRRPVQPGGDRAGTGARGVRRGGLRHRFPAPGQPGDQGLHPEGRRAVLRRLPQPADRAADQRHDVRPAGHAGRGDRRRPAGTAAVPGVRAADRGHHPRLQGGRGARHHPPAADRGEQEGPEPALRAAPAGREQPVLRDPLRPGHLRHLVARASALTVRRLVFVIAAGPASAVRAKGSGPGSVETSASSTTAGPGRPGDPAKRT